MMHRIHRRKIICLALIGILCTPIYLIFSYNKERWSHAKFHGRAPYDIKYETDLNKPWCQHPHLELWDPIVSTHFHSVPPIKCDDGHDWVCIDNGVASLCNEALGYLNDIQCNYTFLERISDDETEASNKQNIVRGGEPVKLLSDFFRVNCTNKNDSNVMEWTNVMAGIKYDAEVHARTGWEHLPDGAMKLNVLIWGFDSLSRLTFMRKLPKTYSYLTEQLQALVLKDYNIVGDGTPQALIPILTGQTELELPETRKRMGSKAQHVNVYPFVWNDYSAKGYVTAYSEDCPSIGTFTYRLKGFGEQPTDHYMRPFYIAAEKEFSKHKTLCLRGTPRHKVLMNWIDQFFRVYKEKPKFMFNFHSELSHDDYNKVNAADDDLRTLLQHLKDENHLNNTVLIVMSDHGHRFASFRETQQGKQEERLPFFSFAFPPWFGAKYPEELKNFQINTGRLSTPFDIYPTLKDILNYEGAATKKITGRSISLFNEIPPNRTCADATIEPHWCACLDTEAVSPDDSVVIKAAEHVVAFINSLTAKERKQCEILSLKKIVRAAMFIPSQRLLKFKQNADPDGFVPDLSDKTVVDKRIYEIAFHTEPGDGHFEASVRFVIRSNQFTVNNSDISRINKYGRSSSCIADTHHQLRPYCYCKQPPS